MQSTRKIVSPLLVDKEEICALFKLLGKLSFMTAEKFDGPPWHESNNGG
jgi:hypothetical protein